MEVAIPIALVIVAIGLMVLEILIPSFGLLTVSSLACFIGALYLGFKAGDAVGWTVVGIAVVGAPTFFVIAFKIFPRTAIGRHMILGRPSRRRDDGTHPARGSDLVGVEGTARSRLRPSGVAEIAGRRVDVLTRGEMIEAGTRIKVLEARGNRIVVRAVESPPENNEEERLR